MKAELRGSDLKCRYGGDEFMVILPDTPLAGAKQVSENLRRAIAEHPVTWNDGQVITASFGITSISQGEHDPLNAIGRADTALYRAKQRGRNGIELEEQPTALANRRVFCRRARRRAKRERHRPVEDDCPVDACEAIELPHATAEALDPSFNLQHVPWTLAGGSARARFPRTRESCRGSPASTGSG